MGELVYIGRREEFLLGKVYPVEADGKSLIIAHTADGFFAALNQCPHLGLALENGTLLGKAIACLWHGAQFDLQTGACLRWAVNDPPPEAFGETPRRLIIFPVIEQDGALFVETG